MEEIKTLLDTLGDKDLAYVTARSNAFSVSEALRVAGFNKAYYYDKPQEDRDRLEDIALKLRRETALRAAMILKDAAILAAEVKVAGLKDRDSRVKQAASTEILDRTVGKPTQQVDVTTAGESITWAQFIAKADSDDTTG